MRRAGAILVTLMAIGVAVAVVGAPAQSAGSYRVDAIFDTAKGIIPGQVVKVAGARVGLVKDVKLTQDYKARIVLSIPRRFEFRADASCNIQPEGLISENFVQCDPGSPSERALGGDPAPTVPVKRTSVPVSITDLFRIFRADVRQRFTVAMMALGGGLASRGADLNNIILRSNPTLGAIRRLTKDLAAQKAQISSAVRDTDTVITELAKRKGRVADFIEQADRVTAQAADHRADIAETIRRLPPLLDATDSSLEQLNRLFRNGQPLLGELRAAAPGLNRALTDIGPFARAARPSLARLGDTANRARRTLKSATPLVGLLRRFTRQAGPTGRALADLLVSLRDRGGVEYLERFVYFSAAATSRYDGTSHILPAHAVDGGNCTLLATAPVAGCNAFFRDNPVTRSAKRSHKRTRGEDAGGEQHTGTPAADAPTGAATPAPTVAVPPIIKPLQDLTERVPDTSRNPVQDLTDFLLGP